MPSEVQVDGRVARGDRTRGAVLDTAVALATEAGLEGLSLGQLAERLGVSKSGLFAHWRSKLDLQLATVERAEQRFTDLVVRPALQEPRGVRRLWALYVRKLVDITSNGLPGGCFFANAQFEFVARPGPVRDRLAAALDAYHQLLERLIGEAVEAGELSAEVDPGQLAFELNAFSTAAVYESRLLAPADVFTFARAGALHRLRELCHRPELLPEE
jgi:AcrR family transcriptional regulator